MSPFTSTFSQRFTNSSSPSVDNTPLIDAIARWWGGSEGLVTAKLLDAPYDATAEVTYGLLVDLLW
jgi:hypothetical protein